MKLRIAEDLSLPIEAVTEKIGFLGRTGGGKSYAAQKLAEEMHAAGAQFVAIDPVGIWWGLRLAKNGKDQGIAIPVLGGLKGDVPLEPSAGKVIADLVVDKGTSVVIDVSQFESDADKTRFATDFAARFFFRKKAAPSPVHIFIEEAQEFVPQNAQRGEERMLHAFHRLIKLGRNFGIGASLISQRPQEVNKKVLNQTELLFAFQLTGPHERKAVEGWIAEKGVDEDIAGELPKLKRGHPHAWSPAWLQISRVVAIGEKWTFDASSTPKVGDGRKVRELAPIDIEQLGAEIKATVERAKADDPRELKKEIASLRMQLTKSQKGATTEKTVIDQGAIDRAVARALSEMRSRIKSEAIHIRRTLAKVNAAAHEIADLMDAPIARLDIAFIEVTEPATSNGARPVAPIAPLRERSAIASRAAPEARQFAGMTEGISRGKQRILDALAELKAFGIDPATRAQAGIMADYNLSGGTGSTHVGELSSAGLVEVRGPGQIALTSAGEQLATQPEISLTTEDFHRRALARLSSGERRILEYLISIYPEAQARAVVGEAVNYNLSGGTGSTHIGKLSTLGFIDIPRTGHVAAGKLLFPEGLG